MSMGFKPHQVIVQGCFLQAPAYRHNIGGFLHYMYVECLCSYLQYSTVQETSTVLYVTGSA